MRITKSKIAVAILSVLSLLIVSFLAIRQFGPQKKVARFIAKARINNNSGLSGPALELYQRALQIDPDNEVALVELGQLRLQMEQPDRAAEVFERCVKAHPKYSPGWLGLIRTRLTLKDFDGALQASSNLLAIIRNAESLIARGDVFAARSSYRDALAAYDAAAALNPQAYAPIDRKVKLLRDTFRNYQAQQVLKAFVRSGSPERVPALVKLAEGALKNEDNEEALQYLNDALALKSTPEARLGRIQALLNLKETDKAAQDLDPLINEYTGKKDEAGILPQAYKLRAACSFERHQVAAALHDAQLARKELRNDPALALLLAKIHLESQNNAQAEDEARRALSINSNYFAAQDFLLQFLIDQRRYEDAIAFGRSVMEDSHHNDGALRLLIRAYIAAGQRDDARKLFENFHRGATHIDLSMSLHDSPEQPDEAIQRISKLDSRLLDTPDVQYQLGRAYLIKNDLEHAARAFEYARTLDPAWLEANVTLAGINFALGNTDVGAQMLQQAVAANPDSAQTAQWLVEIWMQQKKFDAVSDLIEVLPALRASVIDDAVRANLFRGDLVRVRKIADKIRGDTAIQRATKLVIDAVIACGKKEFNGADNLLDQALSIQPAFAPALHEKALLCMEQGRFDAAAVWLEKLEKSVPEPVSRLDYAAALLLAGKTKEADTADFEECLFAKSPESALLSVAAAMKQNNPEAAEAEIAALRDAGQEFQSLEGLMSLSAGSPVLEKLVLGDVYARAGRMDFFTECFDSAEKMAPSNNDLLAWKAGAVLRVGQIDQGEQLLETAVRAQPARTDIMHCLAELKQNRGKNDEAIALYREILKNDAREIRALTNLGSLLLQDAHNDEAAEVLAEAIKVAPQDVTNLNNYVWLLSVPLKSPGKALPYLDDLTRFGGRNAYVLDTAGWVYYLNDNFTQAIQLLSFAAALAPDAPDIIYHYAMALEKNAQHDEALQQLKRAKALPGKFYSAAEAERAINDLEQKVLVSYPPNDRAEP